MLEKLDLIFSILLYLAAAFYLFFGLYVIYMNPKEAINRVFLALCVFLCLWAIGFSIANSAADLETCLIWRRVASFGRCGFYSLLLHFFLLFTGKKYKRKHLKFYLLLYLPALISIYVFAISGKLASTLYEFVKVKSGWINVSGQSGWYIFYYIYYIGYMLAGFIVLLLWRKKASDPIIKKQANILLIFSVVAFLFSSLTDVVLNTVFKGPFPQMAPIFILMPITVICVFIKRYGLMREITRRENGFILSEEARSKLYFYSSFSFLAAGTLAALVYFLPGTVNERSSNAILFASLLLLFFGMSIFISQFIKNKRTKEIIVLVAVTCSIPLITYQLINFSAITFWVFPLIFIVIALLFDTKFPLICLTATAVSTQFLVWFCAPRRAVYVGEFDYIARIAIFLIIFWVGLFVNDNYIKKLKENKHRMQFQKLISDISSDFVSINQKNINEKIHDMLHKVGLFFRVDRTYIFLINQENNTMTYTYEWLEKEICPRVGAIQDIPMEAIPWWMGQLNDHKIVNIENVNQLPNEATAEMEQLIKQEVKSIIAISIEEDGTLLGFMGLDSVRSLKSWPKYHVELLKIIANLLADSLIKINSAKEIEYLAYYDLLTGLPNRTLFSDRLTQAIHLAKRNERFLGVVFMDLDSFKIVNDTLGHSAGDVLLKEVSKGLVQRLRKIDTVARFGGDEFLILVNNLANNEDIYTVVDNIMEMFTHPFDVQKHEFCITGSAGVAVYPFDGDDSGTLIRNADIAMYAAKSKGKNRYTLCTTDMKNEVKKNIRISNSLYRVEERGELMVYYQPQVKLQTGGIIGLEALLRWKHPEMGMIPPGVFIPLAEVNGTINSIGDWVLKEAIQQNKRWQDQGFAKIRMAVNLSVVQFNNANFAESLDAILKETGLDPKYLELEITESVATKEADRIGNLLNRLKQLGISISIDDFGTEYSSLNRLKILPIDRIKIDMQFIQGIDKSEKDRAITKVVINLAKSLGMDVLAEGVETATQLDFLNQGFCDDVQGYYYYKPMPAEEIEHLLRTKIPDKI